MIAVQYSTQSTPPLTRKCIATKPAVHSDRRCGLQIPFSREVFLQCPVSEDTGRTDFDEVPAEFVFENPVLVSTEINMVLRCEDIEVTTTGIIPIEAHAAIALDAAVHLVVYKGAQVLVAVCTLLKAESPVNMPRHDRHVLEMAFSPFITDWTIMRVMKHEPLYHARAELSRLGIVYRYAHAFGGRRHARHDDFSFSVPVILKLFDRTLPACTDRMHCGVPTEIRYVKSEGKTSMEQILAFSDFVRFIFYINRHHRICPVFPTGLSTGTAFPLCAVQSLL